MDQRSILQPSVELENEKEWLSNLQSFVAQSKYQSSFYDVMLMFEL